MNTARVLRHPSEKPACCEGHLVRFYRSRRYLAEATAEHLRLAVDREALHC